MGTLTVLRVRNAKPGRHGDGSGLYLLVKDSGSKSWLLWVQHDGKRRDIGPRSAREGDGDDRRRLGHSKVLCRMVDRAFAPFAKLTGPREKVERR